ncbi:hypothetical protein HZS_1139 [Henneguya salminicola]|nr:hypothetical protein HZS_1139 [Henneguya salminicola]
MLLSEYKLGLFLIQILWRMKIISFKSLILFIHIVLLAFSQNWFFQFEELRLSIYTKTPIGIELIIKDVSHGKMQEYSFGIKNYRQELNELVSSNQFPHQSHFITINMGDGSHTFEIIVSFDSNRQIIAQDIFYQVSGSESLRNINHEKITLIPKRFCPSSDHVCAIGCPFGKELFPEIYTVTYHTVENCDISLPAALTSRSISDFDSTSNCGEYFQRYFIDQPDDTSIKKQNQLTIKFKVIYYRLMEFSKSVIKIILKLCFKSGFDIKSCDLGHINHSNSLIIL